MTTRYPSSITLRRLYSRPVRGGAEIRGYLAHLRDCGLYLDAVGHHATSRLFCHYHVLGAHARQITDPDDLLRTLSRMQGPHDAPQLREEEHVRRAYQAWACDLPNLWLISMDAQYDGLRRLPARFSAGVGR